MSALSPSIWTGCSRSSPASLSTETRTAPVRVSVLSDAGELREQPVQIDGDNALTLPVSIGLSAGAVRLLQSA